jgi:hypothetical protein
MIDAFSMAYSQLLARIALPAAATLLAVLAATGACRAAGCASRRIRRAGGVVTVTFLCTWILAMMGSGSPPTREEKEQMRAAQAEVAAERAAIGGILVGQSGIQNSCTRIDIGELTMENEGASRGDSAILQAQFSIHNSDYAAGFALVHAGTGEVFDFSPTPNAEVCEEWRRFGAADDRQRISLVDDAYDGYAGFPFGTNVIRKLTVFSDGEACVATTNASTTISPLKCVSGILPASHWGLIGGEASQFWSCLTPSNSFVMTWQNVAFGRNPGCLVSFQSELYENGDMEFRYDLSALGDGTVSNVVVGAMNEGAGTTFGELPADTTSLHFGRLDPTLADDPDPDRDGITTADELFTYGTNPYEADSDRDGLGDYAEINETNTDPNDAYSANGVYNDRLAVALGGLDPFSCPDGSTNSVLEHVFYSGTTNGAFAYPVSTDEIGVLKITVSGSGSGRLLVGDAVVPLVGFGTNTLLLAVGKGVRRDLRWDVPDGLDVALGSDDLVIGELPTLLRWKGWIAFPHTDAEIPCIHDLSAKRKTVSLVHGEEFPGLTAEWACGSEDVDIGNLPPVSAEITGNFSTRESRSVSYTVDHPKRLTPSPLVVSQTLRFCPSLPEDDENDLRNAEEYVDEDEELWNCACASGECTCCSGGWCHCHMACCPCNSERDPSIGVTDDQDAANAFSNIVAGVLQEKSNALYLYRANSDTVHLDVPTGEPPFCCGCPDHSHGNYAAKAFCSSRLEVFDGAGMAFGVTNASCDVSVRGVSPSRAFDDASVLFVTNGVSYKRMDYTVLGVRFESADGRPDMSVYNDLSATFGYPVPMCRQLDKAASVAFETDVPQGDGFVKVQLEDVQGEVQLWLPAWTDNWQETHAAELLLDSTGLLARHFTVAQWRNVMWRYGSSRRLEVKVLSPVESTCAVRLEFVASDGDGYVHDHAVQRITSVRPMLLPDYDRGGKFNAMDVEAYLDGNVFPFWTNKDTWRGDDAFEGIDGHWTPPTLPPNDSDMVVNGRNDLVNFLQLALDAGQLRSAWGDAVEVELYSTARDGGAPRFALQDLRWDKLQSAFLSDTTTYEGMAFHESPLRSASWMYQRNSASSVVPNLFLDYSGGRRGVVSMEFSSPVQFVGVRVLRSDTEEELYDFRLPLDIGGVEDFVRWINMHEDPHGRPTRNFSPSCWPDGDEDVHSDATVVFVHGYNVAVSEAWDWGTAAFRRLWRLGLDAGFAIVAWPGNDGQTWIPFKGYGTPDFYRNALNAFDKAPLFASLCNALPGGSKYYIAHSLGNMLVSAAAQDWSLEYERFFMLDAAVPIEAYDPSPETRAEIMTPDAWKPYERRVRPTCWYDLFPEGDGRRLLTWKGRFAGVTNTVNYFSREEEVVNNGDGKWYNPLERNLVWHNQEYRKGSLIAARHNEGGWKFNPSHDVVTPMTTTYGTTYIRERLTPAGAAALSSELMKTNSFFGPFAGREIYESTDGSLVSNGYWYRSMLLTHAIPSESFAAGANPIPAWGLEMILGMEGLDDARNVDMAKFKEGAEDLPDDKQEWVHSYFINRSLKRTQQLYDDIVKRIKRKEGK